MELLIKNGFVYDPINGIDGEKMDIAIKNGKIVESVNEQNAKKIDASGLTVFPGGVDIHCAHCWW
jgi:formylmethanofuran dehydrogenase subunit A